MLGRRGFVRATASLALAGATGLGGCVESFDGADGEPTTTTIRTMNSVQFGTPAFADGASIPTKHTCEGKDSSPRLDVSNVPDDAGSLAVVVDDPDAPSGVFTHWLIWDVSPDAQAIPANVPQTETVEDLGGAKQGENDFGEIGYRGPCPPEDGGPHTYRFTLYVLEKPPRLGAGASRDPLLEELDGIAMGKTQFTGTFER